MAACALSRGKLISRSKNIHDGLCALLRGENVIFTSLYNDIESCSVTPKHAFSSPHLCVYRNLAVEDFVLQFINDKMRELHNQRATPNLGQALFVYNSWSPCIVLGRNQNTFVETSIQTSWHLSEKEIPHVGHFPLIVRRKSGGGCVYHDSGCLCFSFIGPRYAYSPDHSIRVVERAVNETLREAMSVSLPLNEPLKFHTSVGPRHDIFLNQKKVSGSAMRMLQFAAYHHGTILINSDVKNVRKFLQPLHAFSNTVSVQSTGSLSVRSPVTTLLNELQEYSHDTGISMDISKHLFRNTVSHLSKEFSIYASASTSEKVLHEIDLLEQTALLQEQEHLMKHISMFTPWNWIFGGNPSFEVYIGSDPQKCVPVSQLDKTLQERLRKLKLRSMCISIKKGIIKSLFVEVKEHFPCASSIRELCGVVVGCEFRRSALESLCNNKIRLCNNRTESIDKSTGGNTLHFKSKKFVICSFSQPGFIELICDACNL